MRYCFAAIALLFIPASTLSQGALQPIVAHGICDARSGVTIDDEETEQFGCNTAVITRATSGSIIIQFTDRQGDDGRILGFAGTIEGRQGFGADSTQTVAVERLYLAPAANPILISNGTCIMNWTGLLRLGGRLTSVLCGARGQAEGHDIRALAALNVGDL